MGARRIILSMIVLVLIGFVYPFTSVEAAGVKEPTYPPYCWVQPPQTSWAKDSSLWYPCDDPEVQMINCLQLMEIAMKSIDPYMDGEYTGKTIPDNDRVRILKLWDRVKQSCWSDLRLNIPHH